MKNTYALFVFVLLAGSLLFLRQMSAQVPEKMSYQAVIRDAGDQLVANQEIGVRVSILQNSIDGNVVYQEIYHPNHETNNNGLLTFEIGTGVPLSGTFSEIDWSDGPYFLKTEIDPSGGTTYTISGTSQLLSVPYALHSRAADILTGEITENQISDLQDYLTEETDPVFAAWDRSTGIEITESQISDLGSYLTSESDPLFDAAFDFAGAVIGDLLQFDGTEWVRITPGYANASHDHSTGDITSGTLPVTRGGTSSTSTGSAGSVAYSTGSEYSFSPAGTSGQLLVSGGTDAPAWTSVPTVAQINYSNPRTHYAIVGESAFHARQGTESVVFGLGNGGAYIIDATTAFGMKAQALLPVNAVITQIDIGYYDADPDNRINFSLGTHNILGSAYTNLGSVATETSDGYGYVSITGLSYTVPSTREIQVRALPQTNAGTSIKWPGSSLMVKGARIHYQISSAF